MQFYIGKALPKGISRNVLSVYLTLHGNSGTQFMKTKDMLRQLSNLDIVNTTLKKLYSTLNARKLSSEELDGYLEAY